MDGSIDFFTVVAAVGALIPVGAVIFGVLRVTLLSLVDTKLAEAIDQLERRTMSRELLEEKFVHLAEQHQALTNQLRALDERQRERMEKMQRSVSPAALDQIQKTALEMAAAWKRIQRTMQEREP